MRLPLAVILGLFFAVIFGLVAKLGYAALVGGLIVGGFAYYHSR